MNRFHQWIATGGFAGYFPKIPGTFASAVGIGLFYPVSTLSLPIQLAAISLLLALGVWSSFIVEKALNQTDPGIIVIDEIAGIWIALVLIPYQWKFLILSFILFRFFDIKKPFFIHRLQSLKGGWGVMLDDCLAGLYTNLAVQVVHRFWPGY
ncbi:MAG: phosphatidylglycerophosphatase A [Nitrospirae bacterium]|nr:phosphatidylglycerophosphatase A [Nitrospirota bacterium]